MWFKRKKLIKKKDLLVNETFIDSVSIFNLETAEGRVDNKIQTFGILLLGGIFILLFSLLLFQSFNLQIINFDKYYEVSLNNLFEKEIVFAERGIIYDRNRERLAWNEFNEDSDYSIRKYRGEGFGNLLGFINYPQKDSSGNYFQLNQEGQSRLELLINNKIKGKNGSFIYETNSKGEEISKLHLEKPSNGEDYITSIDSIAQEALYKAIKKTAKQKKFNGGAGVLLNIETGEILALVSYPDYDSNILTNGSKKEKELYINSKNSVLLNRPLTGLYTPGSAVKPFFAIAALEEKIVTPETIIVSNGFINIKSVFDEEIVFTYKDWKAHGALDLYDAIAWSSNVYFYYLGGGYENFVGLGIDRINKYGKIFGLDKKTNVGLSKEPEGLIPNPQWKLDRFDENWFLGDTYNTIIGQYNFQVTPLQLTRATAAIANNGYLLDPHINFNVRKVSKKLNISDYALDVVRKGMIATITRGSAKSFFEGVDLKIAGKTGTAQITNNRFNSLLTGYFPYNKPKYAFTIVMESGIEGNGASQTARNFLVELNNKNKSYFEGMLTKSNIKL